MACADSFDQLAIPPVGADVFDGTMRSSGRRWRGDVRLREGLEDLQTGWRWFRAEGRSVNGVGKYVGLCSFGTLNDVEGKIWRNGCASRWTKVTHDLFLAHKSLWRFRGSTKIMNLQALAKY